MFINKRWSKKFGGLRLKLMLMPTKRPPGSPAPVKVRGDIYLAPVRHFHIHEAPSPFPSPPPSPPSSPPPVPYSGCNPSFSHSPRPILEHFSAVSGWRERADCARVNWNECRLASRCRCPRHLHSPSPCTSFHPVPNPSLRVTHSSPRNNCVWLIFDGGFCCRHRLCKRNCQERNKRQLGGGWELSLLYTRLGSTL